MSQAERRERQHSAPAAPLRTQVSLGQAIVLGAIHGVAELLPISSSAHVEAVPQLLGWRYGRLDDELRKAFGVALHAGAAPVLIVECFRELRAGPSRAGRLAMLMAVSAAPAAFTGFVFERTIERRMTAPLPIAFGLAIGSLAMVLADRSLAERDASSAGVRDALWLGLAQAAALLPGVSRTGASVAAARFRRFAPCDAAALSRQVAPPVILGAALLKAIRMRREIAAPGNRGPLTAGALASLSSALLTARLVGRRSDPAPLWPYAAYRVTLAAATAIKARPTAHHRGSARL